MMGPAASIVIALIAAGGASFTAVVTHLLARADRQKLQLAVDGNLESVKRELAMVRAELTTSTAVRAATDVEAARHETPPFTDAT